MYAPVALFLVLMVSLAQSRPARENPNESTEESGDLSDQSAADQQQPNPTGNRRGGGNSNRNAGQPWDALGNIFGNGGNNQNPQNGDSQNNQGSDENDNPQNDNQDGWHNQQPSGGGQQQDESIGNHNADRRPNNQAPSRGGQNQNGQTGQNDDDGAEDTEGATSTRTPRRPVRRATTEAQNDDDGTDDTEEATTKRTTRRRPRRTTTEAQEEETTESTTRPRRRHDRHRPLLGVDLLSGGKLFGLNLGGLADLSLG